MNFTTNYTWYNPLCFYLDTRDIIATSITCIELYMRSQRTLSSRYMLFKRSDVYISSVLTKLDYTGQLIQELHFNCKISNNLMFEYVILCYENWNILIQHKTKLKIPTNPIFKTFMIEHNIDIDKIIPEIIFNYTHVHRPTKTYAYYMSLV